MTSPAESHDPYTETSLEELKAVLLADFPAYMATAGAGGFVWDFRSDTLYLSPGALAVFGLAPDEYDGRPDTMRRRIAVPHKSPPMRQSALGGASEYGAYFQVRARDGSIPWAYVHAVFHRFGEGNAIRAVGLVRRADTELGHAAQQATLAYEQTRQLKVIQWVTAELSRVLTLEDLVKFVTGGAFLDIFDASGSTLSVVDGERCVMIAATGVPDDLVRDLGTIAIGSQLPVAEAVRTQAPVLVSRADVRERYPILWKYVEPTGLTASIVVPFITQQRPTGALSLVYAGKDAFSAEERNLLLTLGSAFSQSVERVRLFEREHAMSVALQNSMLPSRIPRIPGLALAVRYQPAPTGHQVGGDWYDVITRPDGKVTLIVGDMQGHDVQAAAMMGQVRSALRAYIAEGHAPPAAMARASMFLRDQDTDLFATCICVDMDPATGRCLLVRAGHPHPIIRPGHGRSVTLRVPGGLPLGVPDPGTVRYPVSEVQLNADSTVLLCTDGLIESRTADIDTGEQRVKDLLDSGPTDLDSTVERVLSGVEQHHGQEDDIVILLAAVMRSTSPGRMVTTSGTSSTTSPTGGNERR